MNSEVKNMETILPFGNTLRPLVASSNVLSISDLKGSLAQKGVFTSSSSKEDILPLMLTSLLSPTEFENLKEKQKDKESIPKRRSKAFNYMGTGDLINIVPKLSLVNLRDFKQWELENYEIIDVNSFTRIERNNNKLRSTYRIKRNDYIKDWFNQVSYHDAVLEISLDKETNRIVVSTESSTDETKELNDMLVKKVCSILKEGNLIEDDKGQEIKFGDFTNENRINFLLNFANDTLDHTQTLKFDKITNIEISIDSEKALPDKFEWMENKVSNMKFEGIALHETEVLKDTKYHPSLIISLLKINYKFEIKSTSGNCIVEIEFPTKRGKSMPDLESEFQFKFVKITCNKKIDIKAAQSTLYRLFDTYKDACYQTTTSKDNFGEI
jgi:hypothetical protein